MYCAMCVVLILFCLIHTFAQSEIASIKLGVLFPITPGVTGAPSGRTWANIALEAAQTLNNQSYIPGYNLQLVVVDTLDTEVGTVNAALQCALVEKCVGVVGAAVSEFSGLAQYVLQNFSIPQISPISTASYLSDKKRFPTFLRTIPSDAAEGPAIAQAIHHFKWTHVGLITGSDDYSDSRMREMVGRGGGRKGQQLHQRSIASSGLTLA